MVSAFGRNSPLVRSLPVSALEKFPGFGRKISQTLELTVVIGSNLAKADPENVFISGGYPSLSG